MPDYAVYGVHFYGTALYGLPPTFEFTLNYFEANPVGYDRIKVEWGHPSGDWDRMRLVRGNYGFPTEFDDGVLLLEAAPNQATATAAGIPVNPGTLEDTNVAELRFYYYTLWLRMASTGDWRRAGNALALMPKNYRYSERLYELVPGVFRDDDIFISPTSGQGMLQTFLGVFGYELDQFRSDLESLRWTSNPVRMSSGLLPYLAAQLGFPYESELGGRLARQQLLSAAYLYKMKGSRLGIEGFVKVMTGWVPVVSSAAPGTVEIILRADRVNRVENPSFETNASYWTGVTRSTDRALYGTASGLVAERAVSRVPVTTGKQYTASGYVYGPAGTYRIASVDQYVDLPGTSGNYISTPDSAVIDVMTNRLTANESGIETSSAGWGGGMSNMTVARTTAQSLDGVASLEMTSVAAGTMITKTVDTTRIVANPGETWTATVHFRSATVARSAQIAFNWRNATGGYLANAFSSTITTTTTGWTAATVTAVAPAGTERVNLEVQVLGTGAAGEVHYLDRASMVRGTGDIDIRVKMAMDDWTPAADVMPIAKYHTTGNQRSYAIRIGIGGALALLVSGDGITARTHSSALAVPAADGAVKWIRATYDADNGAGGSTANFYTSDDGVTWTAHGGAVTIATPVSIFDSTAALTIGGRNDGTAELIGGHVHYAEVRNGVDGPVVAYFDANRVDATGPQTPNTVTTETGEVWTLNGAGWAWGGVGSGDIAEVTVPADTWTRLSLNVVPATSPLRVEFDGPAGFYLDGVLVETGLLGDYFDASTGTPIANYLWEGTPHLSPSHFYYRRAIKNSRLVTRLDEFLPAGTTFTLLYAEPL